MRVCAGLCACCDVTHESWHDSCGGGDGFLRCVGCWDECLFGVVSLVGLDILGFVCSIILNLTIDDSRFCFLCNVDL